MIGRVYILNQSTANFGRISNCIKISFVGRAPDAGIALRALHIGAGRVRASPHGRIRMRETVHTGTGLGAESREHFFGLFIRFLRLTWTK